MLTITKWQYVSCVLQDITSYHIKSQSDDSKKKLITYRSHWHLEKEAYTPRQNHVALTLGCAPVTVGERAGLPWQQHSEQVGRLYRWRPWGPPRHSSAASRWSHGDWSGMRGEGRWRRSCPCAVGQTKTRIQLKYGVLNQKSHDWCGSTTVHFRSALLVLLVTIM